MSYVLDATAPKKIVIGRLLTTRRLLSTPSMMADKLELGRSCANLLLRLPELRFLVVILRGLRFHAYAKSRCGCHDFFTRGLAQAFPSLPKTGAHRMSRGWATNRFEPIKRRNGKLIELRPNQ